MAKRTPLHLDALPEREPAPVAGPEPTTTVYARVPWSLGERVRDLARARSKATGRRVTVNDLVVEALGKLDR